VKDIFTDIIKNRRWAEVTCGTGSTMQFTQPLRENLKNFLEQHNITSMFDVPCGDYSWMSKTPLPVNLKYIGGDIVESMIEENKNNYPNVEFITFDLSQDKIPAVDLLFCRDCLIHFSLTDITRTFENIVNSDIKYVMLSNYHPDIAANYDIGTGDFRPTDFTRAPFEFEQPIDYLMDWVPGTRNGDQKKTMNLWSRDTIKKYLATR